MLVEHDPAKLAKQIQEIHQDVLVPNQQRDISRANLQLLKPTLLSYLQGSQAICQCKYNNNCVQQHITEVKPVVIKFKQLMHSITPSYLTTSQIKIYDTIKNIIPEVSKIPMICVNSQNPKIRISNYYQKPKLDFFLKELRITTDNICACKSNQVCHHKTKASLRIIYRNMATQKIMNNYTKAMWLTYDSLSKLCLGIPENSNATIPIPKNLAISDTTLKQPTLTIQQAKEYIGFSVSVTRKNGRIQQGVLLDINNNILTLAMRQAQGQVNNFIPLQTIANIKAARPKETI